MLDNRSTKNDFVELAGARLFYEIAGDGEPVVLLHGGFLDGRMWDEQFSFFAQRSRVIRYDRRCAGQTETAPSTEPYAHYQDLYHFLQALHIQQATLVGLSEGARIATDLTIAHPELVQRLVVISPSVSGYTFGDEWIHKCSTDMLQALAQKDLAGAVEAFLKLWVDGPYRAPEQVDQAVRERIREMVTHTFPLTRLAPNTRELDPPAIGRLTEIAVPALIVVGKQDTPDIHENGRLLHQHIAESELVTVPDTGHTLAMEKPRELNVLIERFLFA